MAKPKKINETTEKEAKVEETKVGEVAKEEQVKPKKRTKSQILNELKTRENDINIEILNIGIGNAKFMNKSGVTYFDLDIGESDILSLKLVKEIATKSMSFFRDFVITISGVFPEDIDMDEILMYLGLDRVYKDIENYNSDFLRELILEEDDREFEATLDKYNREFTKMVACKMILLYRSGENVSREKERIVCGRLNIDNLNF